MGLGKAEYLLSICCVPGTNLGPGDAAVNETHKVSGLMEEVFLYVCVCVCRGGRQKKE